MNFFKKKIFAYIKAFGVIEGIKLFFIIRRSKSEHKELEFYINGLEHPIYLRRNSSDFMVFEEIFIDRIYEIPNRVNKNNINIIIDAGSNVGFSSLYFKLKFPFAKIFALEPHHENFKILKKNTQKYIDIITIDKALWHSATALRFIPDIKDSWAFQVEETDEDKAEVISTSINNLCDEFQISSIDILKLDIEGSEKEVFENSFNWIQKTNIIIVEMHENIRKGAEQAVFNALKSWNYTFQNSNYIFSRK